MKIPSAPSARARADRPLDGGRLKTAGDVATLDRSERADRRTTAEVSLTDNERLRSSYQELRGPEDAPRAAASAGVATTLTALRQHLNASLFDGSPLVVTEAEAREAHTTLMQLSPDELSRVVGTLDDQMLSRFLTRIAKAEPFALGRQGPTPLAELANKLALELSPEVGKGLVERLDDSGRRRLLEGVLQLQSSALVGRMREVLGDDGFKTLATGGKCDTLIGRGLVAGKGWRENVTEDFKAEYAAALEGRLPLPERAKETVFLTGPGLFGDQLPGYLEANRRALIEWGVPAENVGKLSYNTADHPAHNADRIYTQIKAQHDQGKRVVVMGHSKFGRDMLEAFARHPDLKGMVDGAVMMQPALSAPIAQDLGRLPKLLEPLLELVGGNRAAFDGLAETLDELPPWPSDVPTMVLASSTESKAALLHAASHAYYQEVYNVASDGAVTLQDQTSLEGSFLVTLPGLADHAQPGLTFTDACEHFAHQMDAGAPDDVIQGMLERLQAMVPDKGPLDLVLKLWVSAHDTPAERARCAGQLRSTGPVLDRIARVKNRHAGFSLVDNGVMTRALVSQLFERMPAPSAAPPAS